MKKIRAEVVNYRLSLARRIVDEQKLNPSKQIAYRLGQGGFFPEDAWPTRSGGCDCSGWCSFAMRLSRKPKLTRPWWIETTAIYNDAMGKQKVFVKLDEPQVGSFVVYPDYVSGGRKREGHIALVVAVTGSRIIVVDCSPSNERRVGYAIDRRDATALFASKKSIYVTLKQDLV